MVALKHKRPETGIGTDSNFHRYCSYNNIGCRAIVEGMVRGMTGVVMEDVCACRESGSHWR